MREHNSVNSVTQSAADYGNHATPDTLSGSGARVTVSLLWPKRV